MHAAWKKYRYSMVSVLSVALFIVIWQIYASANMEHGWINPKFIPRPTDILETFQTYIADGSLFRHIGVSLMRIGEGFAIGTLLAVALGYIIAKNRLVESIFTPIINIIGAIPPYAFMPLFIIWFGVGEQSKIILIVVSTFLPLLSYTVQGIKSIDPIHVRSAMSLGAGGWQVFRCVVFKSALPSIIAGMKVSVSLSFSALIVAEMIGADSGLGYIIVDARNWFKVSDMFMSMVVIAILSLIIQAILNQLEKRLFKWKNDGLSAALD